MLSEAPSATSTIDLNDSRLNAIHTDNPNADAYKLPKGLIRIDGDEIYIRPEIAEKMSDQAINNASWLIIDGAESSANRLVACQQIFIVHAHCEDWHVAPDHDAEVSMGWCGQPLVCDHCRDPRTRIHTFRYEHPYLYDHLMNSAFSVLTFTADNITHTEKEVLEDLVWARQTFGEFSKQFEGEHGWYFLAAFSFEEDDDRMFPRTKFYAIHSGPDLPAAKRLSEMWKTACGRSGSNVEKRTFYTKSELREGLTLAFSGFQEFEEGIADLDGQPEVDFALAASAMTSLFFTYPFGTFRGFDKRAAEARKTERGEQAELCASGSEHAKHTPKCRCGKTMSRPDSPIIVPRHELAERGISTIWHIGPVIYGRFRPQPAATAHISHAPPS